MRQLITDRSTRAGASKAIRSPIQQTAALAAFNTTQYEYFGFYHEYYARLIAAEGVCPDGWRGK